MRNRPDIALPFRAPADRAPAWLAPPYLAPPYRQSRKTFFDMESSHENH